MLAPETFGYPQMGDEWFPGLVRAKDGPIHATAWRLADRHAVILVNISADVQEGTLEVDLPIDLQGRSREPGRGRSVLKSKRLTYEMPPFSVSTCAESTAGKP